MLCGGQFAGIGTPLLILHFRHSAGVAPFKPLRKQHLVKLHVRASQSVSAQQAASVGEAPQLSQSPAAGAGDANALSLEDGRAMTDAISSSSTEISPHRESLDASREESSPGSSVSKEDLLELGCFGTPHGVRGEIRLFPTTDSADERLLQPGKRWTLPREKSQRRREHVPKEIEIVGGRPILLKGREVWLLRVKGYDSPEAVDMLKGLRLLMPACERPALDSTEEFYVQELIGMQVIMQASGDSVGVVVDVYDGTGTYDILRIALKEPEASSSRGGGGERTTLLPFATEIVPVVDRASRYMEITPPEGLLDLVTVTKKKVPTRPRRR